jgi:hypothetical protein
MNKAAAAGAKELEDQAKPRTPAMTYDDAEKEKRYQLYKQGKK